MFIRDVYENNLIELKKEIKLYKYENNDEIINSLIILEGFEYLNVKLLLYVYYLGVSSKRKLMVKINAEIKNGNLMDHINIDINKKDMVQKFKENCLIYYDLLNSI